MVEYSKRTKHDVVLITDKNTTALRPWLSQKVEIIEVGPLRTVQAFERLHPILIKLPQCEIDVLVSFVCEILSEGVVFRNKLTPSIAYVAGLFRFVDSIAQKFKFSEEKLVWVAKLYGLFAESSLSRYSKLVANSSFVKEKIVKLTKLERNHHNVEVINPGVDTHFFKPINVFDNYFLAVSRIDPLKRLDLLISAFNRFRQMGNKDFRLVVAGYLNPKNRSYLDHLQRVSGKHVEFIINPADESLVKLYQHSYAFLFTALKEPFGITPLEAMSCGKPVIATGLGGYTDYMVNSQNSLLVAPNPIAIAEAMSLLGKDDRLFATMTDNARKTALALDWEVFTQKMDRLVDLVAEDPRH